MMKNIMENMMKNRPENKTMETLNNCFGDIYSYIYDNEEHIPAALRSILVSAGDNYMKRNHEKLIEFCRYRMDYVTSDREVIAFMLASLLTNSEQTKE